MSEEMKDAIADLRRAMTRLELDLMDKELDKSGHDLTIISFRTVTERIDFIRDHIVNG